jgi:hypothetical protein
LLINELHGLIKPDIGAVADEVLLFPILEVGVIKINSPLNSWG